MERDSPYEFGDATTDGGLVDGPPEGQEHGTDMVVVDGDLMSYRSYERSEE